MPEYSRYIIFNYCDRVVLKYMNPLSHPDNDRLTAINCASNKLIIEASEAVQIVCKVVYQGKKFDYEEYVFELGDYLFYVYLWAYCYDLVDELIELLVATERDSAAVGSLPVENWLSYFPAEINFLANKLSVSSNSDTLKCLVGFYCYLLQVDCLWNFDVNESPVVWPLLKNKEKLDTRHANNA